MLGTGSEAATSIQVPGLCSRRQPVTETMSTFLEAGCATASAANPRTRPRAPTREVRMGPL
jgi:hypothetical protein